MHWTHLLALLAAASARKPLSPSPRTPRHLSKQKQRARLDIRGGASDAVATPTSLNELQLLCEKEEGVCVVDFGATWCGPCQRIAPVFDQLAEGCPDALFAKVDVDEVPDASQHYSVSALPTFLVFKDGTEVARIQGADEAGLRAALDKAGCPPPKNDIFELSYPNLDGPQDGVCRLDRYDVVLQQVRGRHQLAEREALTG